VAFFSFTSCEGCQLTVLGLEDDILDMLQQVEIVNFREAIDDRRQDYEISFVEGSITTGAEAEEVKEIRERAKFLVAMGACACLGGVNALKERHDAGRVRHKVYGEEARHFPTLPTRRVRDVVPVDYELHGCPIVKQEFVHVVKALLIGQIPIVPDRAVCTDCKVRANACLYDRGICCLGPVARSGCGAICPTFGEACAACRGFVSDPNLASMIEIMKSKGKTREEVQDALTHYNALTPVELKTAYGS
jgi:coenzyme F420-reducing hydrogenase gamma subunit